MTYLSDVPQPPPILARLDAFTRRATFADTCEHIASEFRAHARDYYQLGDDGRGDAMTTRALAWELAAMTNDLTVLAQRP